MTRIRDGIKYDISHPDYDLYIGLLERIDLAARSGTGVDFSYDDLVILSDFGLLDQLEDKAKKEIN